MANVNGNAIGYIFKFADAGAASRDAVVGSYFFMNMDIYDTLVNSVTPLSGFYAMVVQPYPLVPALQNHPNLVLANNGNILQPSVIINNGLPDLGYLMIIVQGFCVYALPGLQLQTTAPVSNLSDPVPIIFN